MVLSFIRRPIALVAILSFVLGLGAAVLIASAYNSRGGTGSCADAGSGCSALAATPGVEKPTIAIPPTSTPTTLASRIPAATVVAPPTNAPIVTVLPTAVRAAPEESVQAPAAAIAPTMADDMPMGAHDPPVETPADVAHATAPDPPAASGAGCVANCGEPRYFCDNWSGGFCDDFRDKGSGATHVAFPAPGDPYSFDAFNTTYPFAQTEGPAPADGLRAFSANEHFMTVIEDGQFGLGVLRLRQPFDFSGREGHLHFDVDLKTGARRYVRLLISPDLTKVTTDDRRQVARRPGDAFDLWFVNGTFDAQVSRDGALIWEQEPGRYYGQDDVRDHVDVYISRGHVRVLVNGTSYLDSAMPDLGFERAYMYLAQASYNPCKGFESFGLTHFECEPAAQMFHWDNLAFDGPALAQNSLTPAGSRDVVFDAFHATSCTVKGAAAAPVGPEPDVSRVTWRVRLPADGSSVSPPDVVCQYALTKDDSAVITGFEIVEQ